MAPWYTWLITILGAVSIFTGGAFYVLWNARREVEDKIKVDMRTVSGQADDFLAKVQGDFVIFPKNKQCYVETIVDETKTKMVGVDLNYFYDSRATVKDYHPSKRGWLSMLSAPIERVSYNEGDPVPIPRIRVDEEGKIVRPAPIDRALTIALSKDESFLASVKMMGDEATRYRNQLIKLADKFVPKWIHYVHILITMAVIGALVYGFYFIVNELTTIKEGLGL